MVTVPVVVPAVKVSGQVPLATDPNESAQLVGLMTAPGTPPVAKVTIPVGVIAVPAEVSVTIAIQVAAWLNATVEGVQAILVVVEREVTMTFVLPLVAE